jgi:hypothetical protein
MAEIVKKAKTPAKPKAAASTKSEPKASAPRKTASRKTTATVDAVRALTPTHEEIARLAERYWAERGYHDGYAEQDWLRAEQELVQKAS